MNILITDVFSHNPTYSCGLNDPGLNQEMTHGYGIKDPWSVVQESQKWQRHALESDNRRGARDLVEVRHSHIWVISGPTGIAAPDYYSLLRARVLVGCLMGSLRGGIDIGR